MTAQQGEVDMDNNSGTRAFLRLLWQVSGANPEKLPDCPPHERWKYIVLGLLHLLIAGAFALLASKVALDLFTSLFYGARQVTEGIEESLPRASRAIALLAAGFVGLVAFAFALLLLVSAMRGVARVRQRAKLTRTGSASAVRSLAGAVESSFPAVLLAMLFAGMVWYLAWWSGVAMQPNPLSLLVVMSFLVVLAPPAVATIWTSPIYDGLAAERPPGADAEPAAPPPAAVAISSHSAPSEGDLRLEADFTEAFERNPGNVAVGRKLIDVRRRLGRQEQALAVYNTLISADPQNIALIREKAQLHRQLGDDVRYRKTLEQADRLQEQSSFEQNAGQQYQVRQFEVQGLDFFADFKWQLQPGVNILLGRNGYGKSLLLRALVAMIQNDQEQTAPFMLGAPTAATPRMQVTIERAGETVVTKRSVISFDEQFGKMPVLAIPDMRYLDKSGTSIGTPREVVDLRSDGASQFLNEESYEGLINTFLYGLCLDYLERGNKTDAPIFALIEKSVQTLSGGPFKFKKITRNKDTARFEILTTTEGSAERELPLQKASQGTLSVIAMVGLIHRYLQAVYTTVEPAEVAKQRAVVVIDEIDAHLHPSWQQQILRLFRDAFPGVQFIVTAHSPLVVGGALEREVAVLRKDKKTGRFYVEVRPEHFIGATSAAMYQRLFDIDEEEKDRTYKKLEVLQSTKSQLERDVKSLKAGESQLTADEKQTLQQRESELYYVRQFEEVRSRRESLASATDQKQKLQMEMLRMQGKLEELTRELTLSKKRDPAAGAAASRAFFASVLERAQQPADAIESFAEKLAASGRNVEAAEAWGALAHANPAQPKYWKALALEHEKLADFAGARKALEEGLKSVSDPKQLQDALDRVRGEA
jgi:tetratricopeptide (TPR) repeat protein